MSTSEPFNFSSVQNTTGETLGEPVVNETLGEPVPPAKPAAPKKPKDPLTEAMKGRLESEIPMNDPYWSIREEERKKNAKT